MRSFGGYCVVASYRADLLYQNCRHLMKAMEANGLDIQNDGQTHLSYYTLFPLMMLMDLHMLVWVLDRLSMSGKTYRPFGYNPEMNLYLLKFSYVYFELSIIFEDSN